MGSVPPIPQRPRITVSVPDKPPINPLDCAGGLLYKLCVAPVLAFRQRLLIVALTLTGLLLPTRCMKPDHAPAHAGISGERFPFAGSPTPMWAGSWDSDGDSVSVRFAWGDGDTSEWSPYFIGPGEASMTHVWAAVGTHTVTAQAKDKRGATSDWSSGHTIYVIHGWSRTFGSPSYEYGQSVQQTQDGGYIIAANSSVGNGVAWLIKTDANGDTIWTRSFGGADRAWCNSARQTADGGYIIIAGLARGGNSCDLWFIKTDANGDTTWTRRYSGTDGMGSVQQTQDGGYVAVANGAGGDDIWLLKVSADGDTTWTRTFGGPSVVWASSVEQTRDGGYVIAGERTTTDSETVSTDMWLLKTDANGDTIWTRTFGGSGTSWGASVGQTQDGGYIITGSSDTPGESGLLLMKTDARGNPVWVRGFGGATDAKGNSVEQTQDGGYVVAGVGPVDDVWLIKTDADGDTLWTRTFGWEPYSGGNCVEQTQDGGYVVVGTTDLYGEGKEDVWLIRLEPDGLISAASRPAPER